MLHFETDPVSPQPFGGQSAVAMAAHPDRFPPRIRDGTSQVKSFFNRKHRVGVRRQLGQKNHPLFAGGRPAAEAWRRRLAGQNFAGDEIAQLGDTARDGNITRFKVGFRVRPALSKTLAALQSLRPY
jgi:hypothetical protein